VGQVTRNDEFDAIAEYEQTNRGTHEIVTVDQSIHQQLFEDPQHSIVRLSIALNTDRRRIRDDGFL
jgi:hypothetical protein